MWDPKKQNRTPYAELHDRVHRLYARLYGAASTANADVAECILSMMYDREMQELLGNKEQGYLEPADLVCESDRYDPVLQKLIYRLGPSQNPYDYTKLNAQHPVSEQVMGKLLTYMLETGSRIEVHHFCQFPMIEWANTPRWNFEAFVTHPYWATQPEDLQIISGYLSIRVNSEAFALIQNSLNNIRVPDLDLMQIETADDVAALVTACRAQGSLKPLTQEMSKLERTGDRLAGNVVEHVGSAFALLQASFWETRELVNAIKPGSYAYPVQRLEAPKLEGKLQRLRALFQKPAMPAVPQLDPVAQYAITTSALRHNIQRIGEAEESLFSISSRGEIYAGRLRTFSGAIRDYLGREDGRILADESPMLHSKLLSSEERLTMVAGGLELAHAQAYSVWERIEPVGKSLSRALTGSTVAMTVQTAQMVTDNERVVVNFENALGKMLDAAKWINTAFSAQAHLLTDGAGKSAGHLIKAAQDLETQFGNYREQLAIRGPYSQPQPIKAEP